ncbi:ABC transporter substrate-binding protein [Marinobacter sp. F3R11]|uniref:ABC transporter substrate-binding protein n=1 Tax=Marinobacter sp. F3R11 TaxID=2267231 RepID=UPI000DE874A9|nr:ABC transporter substrate-binding protein [Marinobacter sp. F3R11]RBW51785.1 ABC transporter substrate-binding protein [Marinobacter sp. F3R11]
MKRSITSLAVSCIITLGGAQTAAAENLTRVTAGHLIALDMAPLFVAKESGCFAKYGLEVDTRFFANPGDNSAALAGGAIDFSTNPFTLAFFAANSGVPIRVVSAAGGWGVMEVVADGDLGLNSMEDLRDHIEANGPRLRAAVLQGDTLELILVAELERMGLDTDAVEFVYFDDLLAMVESFRSGNTDILSHIKPYTSDMVASRGATVITNNAEAWATKAPNTVVSVLESTLQERPELVEGYLRGLRCAADIINNDLPTALSYLEDGNYFRVSEGALEQAFNTAPAPISFDPDIESVQRVLDDLEGLGYIKPGTTADSIFRTAMIKALEQE